CLCKKCHPIYPWQNEAHSTNDHSGTYKCVACHVGLPHGSNFGRLIADEAKGAPYDYGDLARNTAFTKASPPKTAYTSANCSNSCAGQH
ncbi:MAG: hypothetical protein KKI12_11885, partial [Proteobacteria bacterium]|nr:hypothetical protein [Pseudomonadota bacterium]